MARYGRGLICMPMTGRRLDELQIPMMVRENTSRFETAFAVSIEARDVTSTGISAADRAATVRVAIDPTTRPADLAQPGHMFPLRARRGGVLVRAGQTEAAVDLARMAGLYPAGVICEIMNDDGTMARVKELSRFAKRHRLLMNHHRRPHQVPHAPRSPREAGCVGEHADRPRRLSGPCLRE